MRLRRTAAVIGIATLAALTLSAKTAGLFASAPDAHPAADHAAAEWAAATPTAACTDRAVLFAKFHKVGGTTFMRLINRAYNTTEVCAASCGAECPHGEPTSVCTGHPSLTVTSEVLRSLVSRQQVSEELRSLVSPQQVSVPAEQRRARQHAALLESGARWLRPCPAAAPHVGLRTATLLRDPVERLRSKYYFQRTDPWCASQLGKRCVATRMTFLEWMTAPATSREARKLGTADKVGTEAQACCEYVTKLGGGSVKRAVRTLLSQFDVVGVTERYEEAVLMLSDALELPPERLRYGASSTVEVARNNTAAKLPWTDAERRAAAALTAKDRKIYEFAEDLARRRAEALYGGPRALHAAVRAYRSLPPSGYDQVRYDASGGQS